MRVKNVVLTKGVAVWTAAGEREAIPTGFDAWMRDRGWQIRIRQHPHEMRISRRFLNRFKRRRLSDQQILDQGRWVARAFEAIRGDDSAEVVLLVSEGASYATHTSSIEWRA